ncbi:MAG TPA: type II toxin-antitoxin system HicA family toxin [Ktedonobacteraceae bacterium]
MPPKLPRVSGEQVITVLQRFGFVVTRQRGSHIMLKKRISKEEEIGCVVPLHRELAIGTLRSILRQARITPEEFMENW